MPRMPKWLDRRAKAAWKRLVPRLERMGVLAGIDGHALARYCQTWSQWREAQEFIAKNGWTYPARDKEGNVMTVNRWPQVAIASDLADKLTRLEQQFGMTPSARTRLVVNPPAQPCGEDRFGRMA